MEERNKEQSISKINKTSVDFSSTYVSKKRDNNDRKGSSKYAFRSSSKKLSSAEVKKNIETKIDAFFEANKEFGIKKLVSTSRLIEIGANVGTYPKHWNPKMKPYIYSKRAGKNIFLDLLKSMVFLDRAYNFLRDITKEGGRVLFVGTRGDIIKNHVKEETKRAKSFYVNQRWLGGTLTNFRTINSSIAKLNNLIMMQLSDEIKKYSKKEQLAKAKETERLGKFFGGVRTMKGLPQAIVVLDPVVEHNAIEEANKLKIPVVALANTNADPTNIDFIIPCNTSSVRTVHLLTSVLCDAICEALGEPLKVVGKPDSEIILPEVVRRVPGYDMVNRVSFTKGSSVSSTENK